MGPVVTCSGIVAPHATVLGPGWRGVARQSLKVSRAAPAFKGLRLRPSVAPPITLAVPVPIPITIAVAVAITVAITVTLVVGLVVGLAVPVSVAVATISVTITTFVAVTVLAIPVSPGGGGTP